MIARTARISSAAAPKRHGDFVPLIRVSLVLSRTSFGSPSVIRLHHVQRTLVDKAVVMR
jgi:hypothetical protein